MFSINPAFSIWIASREDTAAEGDFPTNFRHGHSWDAACRPHGSVKRTGQIAGGAVQQNFRCICPAASHTSRRSGVAADHTDTVANGGSRRT